MNKYKSGSRDKPLLKAEDRSHSICQIIVARILFDGVGVKVSDNGNKINGNGKLFGLKSSFESILAT